MRPKNFSKRMVLNKTTIANLVNQDMKEAKGGACLTELRSCTTWGEYSCMVSPYVCYSYPVGFYCKGAEPKGDPEI